MPTPNEPLQEPPIVTQQTIPEPTSKVRRLNPIRHLKEKKIDQRTYKKKKTKARRITLDFEQGLRKHVKGERGDTQPLYRVQTDKQIVDFHSI